MSRSAREPAGLPDYDGHPAVATEAEPASYASLSRRGRRSRGKTILLVGLLLGAVAAAVVVSLARGRTSGIPVETAIVRKSAITRKVSAAGKLQAATVVKVSSSISGDLIMLPVKEGELVKKGQLVAKIDARRNDAQVKQQEAALAGASADFTAERVAIDRFQKALAQVQRLAAKGDASRAEVDRATSDLRSAVAKADAAKERIAQARAALVEARHVLSFATIYAPIEGIVVARSKELGERVRGSDFNEDPIVTIATLSNMEARVEVGEHEVVFLREGEQAVVEVDAFPDQKFQAEVIEVARNATIKNAGTEAEVTTFPVRLALVSALPGALPGMSCEVTISTKTHQGVLVVPIQAVTVRADRELDKAGRGPTAQQALPPGKATKREPLTKIVFAVQNGVARARRVQTGLASEDEIEITSGLAEGELIVEGPYRVVSRDLADGKPVRLEPGPGGTPTEKGPR